MIAAKMIAVRPIYSLDNLMFILHRLTGLGLLAFLLAHIWIISTGLINSPTTFDNIMQVFARREFLPVDLALFGCVFFHSLNGLRLMLNEVGISVDSKDIFNQLTLWTTLVIWVLAIATGVLVYLH